ncbi:MAG: ATP-binding cassette domain-containing protein, partial [Flammeovirgaceae bacterium]
MLKVENISSGYGKKQVLFDVSLEVKQGEIVLLVGSNGSGKSTLLKAIYGIVDIWEGSIQFENKLFHEASSQLKTQTSNLIKQGLMYIPQKNNLFEDLTVKENLQMAGLILTRSQLKQRMENALSVVSSLQQHLYRTPQKLSGGERQL